MTQPTTPWPTSPHGPDDNHTSDGRCKYPAVCAEDGHVPAPDVHAHIETICHEAGYGVMVQVLGILVDREVLPDEALLALTPEDVNDFYDGFVGKAIDKIEDSLLSKAGL